ncbi:RdgB/HAM1 family non-canonical purine NTP pyrophosphatase [Chitinibacter bivalviorum]|uniref:dITP/XTP pyrophosphatase n=1 Tax=Chitinibacter bivalviorum TaxID=2739434 RepID=A0A7H9BGF3_9NEIS|nr:RdgB/HAM1 family non-canonical purine NTP pyrophosphatase [Chitinibacter bivalviorum]QLG87803.1 RdgB/HAM1 family non-canonical purine NTP pyrophosphatase [Chitinibacter bivalviorum]
MQRIVLASNNAGKLKEFSHLLAPLALQVIPQGDLNVPECPEPFGTFVENALAKARHAAKITGLPALADDSGLCVHALGGAPGVYSARYGGEPKSDQRNNEKLLAALAGKPDRRAWYYAALVLVRSENDPQPLIADGVCVGEIAQALIGEGGFGYDPLFWLPNLGKTVAQISASEKSQISHRAKALNELISKLRETGL